MRQEPSKSELLASLQKSFLLIQKLKKEQAALIEQSMSRGTRDQKSQEPIAIIGMGCRFPGADNPEAFWQMLLDGVDAIGEVGKDRWDMDAFYDPDPDAPGKMSTRYGGFLGPVDGFDAQFFSISPREAISLDPQQRMLLEVSWEALEYANLLPDELFGTSTGVFVGICRSDYIQRLGAAGSEIDAYFGTGNAFSVAAGRLSYILGLKGPSMAVDTACSSSLVTVHLACDSLRRGECDVALAGGVNLILTPDVTINFSKARMMAPDGRCKTFSAQADGYGRGEGCGMIVLKRLSDAQAAGDNILALIRGSAANQDGASGGLTIPSGPSQEEVIRQALKNSDLSPHEVSYIEAHGTGTPLGDPIEVQALATVFAQEPRHHEPLMIGSVKTNIGHLEGAAGIAGLIKLVLSLQHQTIPPHLHFDEPNPRISFHTSEGQALISVPTEPTPWQAERRIGGVSSFGFSGTNAHVILEGSSFSASRKDAAKRHQKGKESLQVFTLSGKTKEALHELAGRYEQYLGKSDDAFADICLTANTRRTHFTVGERLALVAASKEEAREKLAAFIAGGEPMALFHGQVQESPPRIAFLFTGQGSQYVGMGRALYESHPTFREALDRCDEILQPYLKEPLLSILYPEELSSDNPRTPRRQAYADAGRDAKSQRAKIDSTAYTQPALFALEYALAQLWKSWGIEPDVVMGHSVGEYVAACVAGVLSLEDGLKLIAERGRLMQALPTSPASPLELGGTEGGRGKMVAVLASEAEVLDVIAGYAADVPDFAGYVSLAAINGPRSVVVSGAGWAVQAIAEELTKQGIRTQNLQVSHAFHSPLMEPMLRSFARVARRVKYNAPAIPIISNVTGQLASEEMTSATYWVRHIRQPVRFADGMKSMAEEAQIFIEIGPKPVLLGMARRVLASEGASLRVGEPAKSDNSPSAIGNSPSAIGNPLWLPSLRPDREDRNWDSMLASVSELYVCGVPIKWEHIPVKRDSRPSAIILPTYPWQHERFWVDYTALPTDLHKLNASPDASPTLLGKEWLIEMAWRQMPLAAPPSPASPIPLPIACPELAEGLGGARGGRTWLILADTMGVGEALAQQLEEHGQRCVLLYYTNLTSLSEFERLFQENSFSGIVHLWSLDIPLLSQATLALEEGLNLGCRSLLSLMQAFLRSQKGPEKASLRIVTQNATACRAHSPTRPLASGEEVPLAPLSATLWGLGKVVALEHAEIWGGLLDLAHDASVEEKAAILFGELSAATVPAEEVAYRKGERYVARIVPAEAREDASPKGHAVKADGSYLITGGLGALGLRVTAFLAEQGAKQLVLTGRRGAAGVGEQAQAQLNALEEAGVKVMIVQADVSLEEDVVRMLDACPKPLRGIIHAAGVLDDGILLRQSWQRFEKVMAAKVQGAWHLHQLSQEAHDLDFFVLFSSVASLLGSPGQANYAAANAFMDALAHYRQALGLPALSINWGPWAEEGMAAESASRRTDITPIAPEDGLQLLAHLLTRNKTQVGVLQADWSAFAPKGGGKQWPLLTEITHLSKQKSEAGALNQPSILAQIEKASNPEALITAHVQEQVGKVLRIEAPKQDIGFANMGLDSLMALELKSRLENSLNLSLPATLAFEYPTIKTLADYLSHELLGSARRSSAPTWHDINQKSKIQNPKSKIAIIGMGCRFPGGANNPEAFWALLRDGVDAVTEIPRERWNVDAYYDPDPDKPGKMYTRQGAFLDADAVDHFDPFFFGMTPREAVSLDPQQRLLLEVSWETLENAGYAPDQLRGSHTGIFVGIGSSDYAELLSNDYRDIQAYDGTGNHSSFASGRVSYTLGLQGPNMAIDTACSSSLVALHQAIISLQAGECDAALAGGVHLILSPRSTIALSRMKALSPDGRCKTFSAQADGYGRGEGCGMVMLKRLSDAEADGDNILAVIRGSVINHDGPTSGLTVPNKLAQEALIRQALQKVDVTPTDINYVEAHGTGTALGDPLEVRALVDALGERERPLLIGSVKTNIGHLEAASGIAGLIKVVLSLQHGEIPPHLHFNAPNPHLNWDELPIKVPTECNPWTEGERIAGVSSFGLSGTNVHVILSDAAVQEPNAPSAAASFEPPAEEGSFESSLHFLTLSAKTEEALQALVRRYLEYFVSHPAIDFADVCFTSNMGRSHFSHRLAIHASSINEASEKLLLYLNQPESLQNQEELGIFYTYAKQAESGGSEDEEAAPSPSGSLASSLTDWAKMYVQGAEVNWTEIWPTPRQRMALPTYPFQRQRHWVKSRTVRQQRSIREHTLLGQKLRLPLLKETIFESQFSSDAFPFLLDHRIYEQVVVPGGCHLALFLVANQVKFGEEACHLQDILFPQALVLKGSEPQTLQLVLTPHANGVGSSFKIITLVGEEESQVVHHAIGTRIAWTIDNPTSKEPMHSSLSAQAPEQVLASAKPPLGSRLGPEISATVLYERLHQQQVQLGASFRWIESVWTSEAGELLAKLRTPEPLREQHDAEWLLHPSLIDACFQLLVMLGRKNNEETMLPWHLETFRFYGVPVRHNSFIEAAIETSAMSPSASSGTVELAGEVLWCHARQVSESNSDKFIADIQLMSQNGEVIADILGFEAHRVPRESLIKQLEASQQASSARRTVVQQSMSLGTGIKEELAATPIHQRRKRLGDYLHTTVAQLIGLSPNSRLISNQALFDLGLDSLMALEFKGQLENDLGCALHSTLLFDYPTLQILGDYLAEEILNISQATRELPDEAESDKIMPAEPPTAEPLQPEEQAVAELSAELDQFSQDDLAALLDEKLANLDFTFD